ncbi:hypothetical protein [Thermoanaerobacterium thermosaccharolyticum]|uniref:hypothetical protein n=1 Tax=Thermoanaerobacterium thermosaccharolyticum TaxID=1517 RepID=UPI00177DBB02|nr:hypothetical protein [Thermoanaerobacterium thermosaccharolyticum]MBE0069927.1 hypothetical protein [Thermoanaerobacterium thermosaccharolyticum]MBE0228055.1 hypothetical protein [Thermoanaerobacterium thermosaccharolyticum]
MSNKVIKKIRIRCSRHLHEIGLNQKGQLIFFNHTKAEIKAEQALYELGAEPCGCLMFLKKWREGKYHYKFKKEADVIKHKRLRRLLNQYKKKQYRIIDLYKLHPKLYMDRQKDLSIKLFKKTFKGMKMFFHIIEGYSYLEIIVTFTSLNNFFSVTICHNWWQIHKTFNGGIVDNKIITSVNNMTSTSADVFATDFFNGEHYRMTLTKNNKGWKVKKEELI